MERIKSKWSILFGGFHANLALRCVVMFAGIACIACGIALAKLSCTGTSPISSLPAVFTEITANNGLSWFTMGMWTFVFNALFFIGEIVLLRAKFRPIQFLQIPLFMLLSVAVDLWIYLLSDIPHETYLQQLAFLAVSIIMLGLGIRVQLASHLLMTPGDAIVQAIAYVSGEPFPKCKVTWDICLITASSLLSLLVLGGLHQVREGTIFAALLVGTIVGFWSFALRPIRWLLPRSPREISVALVPSSR